MTRFNEMCFPYFIKTYNQRVLPQSVTNNFNLYKQSEASVDNAFHLKMWKYFKMTEIGNKRLAQGDQTPFNDRYKYKLVVLLRR